MVACEGMEGEMRDVGVVSMSQLLLRDPRIAQLDRIKPVVARPEPGDLVRLPLVRKALIYQRLSTHEQRKKSLWSLEMQDALSEQAKADGYREDQIIVERRDLGISGTKGWEERPGLAALIKSIEADAVEAVYVVHISRISRDQTLIDGLEFGELCKQHHVLIVMPTMRLNLRDSMHTRLYRQEIERAADEIELLKLRLGGPLRHKALSGRFDGRGVAAGYLLDHDRQSEQYERYVIYPPHAEVVRAIFRALLTTGTPTRAARWLRERQIRFPPFGPEVPPEDTTRCSLARSKKPLRGPGGYAIAPSLVKSIATNPVYLGWWLVDGQVINPNNHPAIIEEETFLLAQEILAQHGRRRPDSFRLTECGPQLLSGMLWCQKHEVPYHMISTVTPHAGRYRCDHDFHIAQTDHLCTILDARILYEPITDLILRHCSFADHAEAVLAQIDTEYSTAREEARWQRRELSNLQQEVETLKHNLALTRTPGQIAIIFEQIDQRMERITALADEHNSPMRRILSAAQVATVKAFLADLRTGWDKQPPELRNELFRVLLERVSIASDADHVTATVVWRTGLQQRLWIERPRFRRGGKVPWTATENAWLRKYYTTATPEDIQAQFPQRSANAIRQQASRLGLDRRQRSRSDPKNPNWSPDETVVLHAYAAGEISYVDMIARLPGRSWDGIQGQAGVLGLRLRHRSVHYRVLAGACDTVLLENHAAVVGSPPNGGLSGWFSRQCAGICRWLAKLAAQLFFSRKGQSRLCSGTAFDHSLISSFLPLVTGIT
jgi:DNA invertase Pin-like site-specific DNA recombinase